MLPVDAEDYEKRIAGATDALDAFYAHLIGELDDQNGAFSCWGGYCDWKTLILLADYLIQSVRGVSDALLSASFAAFTHRQATFADTEALKRAQREGRSPFPLNAQSRRRHLTITQSQEACFFHLGQTLDRLAVAVIIVGGFEVEDVVKVNWGELEKIADDLATGSTEQRIQPAGSRGRAVQSALVAPVLNWQQAGPHDWLLWLRSTRNGMTHRARAQKIVAMTTKGRLARLFYRQPHWSELQSLVYGARPPKKLFYDAFVMSASEDILDGLCESTTKLVEAVVKAMVVCWNDRAADPTMIVQHGKGWRAVEPAGPMSSFPGYGTPVTLAKDNVVRLHPLDARRWEAARAMDDRRQDWY